jgi:hypothetical protein
MLRKVTLSLLDGVQWSAKRFSRPRCVQRACLGSLSHGVRKIALIGRCVVGMFVLVPHTWVAFHSRWSETRSMCLWVLGFVARDVGWPTKWSDQFRMIRLRFYRHPVYRHE